MPSINRQRSAASSKSDRSKSKGSILDRLKPIEEASDKKDTVNIYGISGTGKTTLACSYPKPLLLIGAEDGTKSVRNVKGVEFVKLEHSSEIKEVLDYCREEEKYKTVVLDTATSLQAMVLKEILGLEEIPVQNHWGMASRDQYGECALMVKEYLRHILRLAEDGISNAIILAQERQFENESTGELIAPTIMSSLTASTVGWLNPECDFILQTFIRLQEKEVVKEVGGKKVKKMVKTNAVEYCLRTKSHPIYTVKFRGPKNKELPDCITDPSYEKIQQLLQP